MAINWSGFGRWSKWVLFDLEWRLKPCCWELECFGWAASQIRIEKSVHWSLFDSEKLPSRTWEASLSRSPLSPRCCLRFAQKSFWRNERTWATEWLNPVDKPVEHPIFIRGSQHTPDICASTKATRNLQTYHLDSDALASMYWLMHQCIHQKYLIF